MAKRAIAFLLAAVIIFGTVPILTIESNAAETYVIGNDVTIPSEDVPADGSNPYCNCGIRIGKQGHWCCWIYGYRVYCHVWGDLPDRTDASTNYLRDVAAKNRKLTAKNLEKYLKNAVPGALLRIDSSASASASDSDGHTLIFVGMNDAGDGAIMLEGNYDGRGRTRIHEWLFADLVSSYGPGSSHDYQYIKYILWPDAPAYADHVADYLDQCDSYPSYCTIGIQSDTATVWDMPCSSETSPYAREIAPVQSGEQLTAVGLFRNTAGNLWYKVITPNGENSGTGYIYAGHTAYLAQLTDDVTVTGISAPTQQKQGKSFSIKGTLTADHQYLYEVTAWVADPDGNYVIGSSEITQSSTYTLYQSNVDRSIKFGTLDLGQYTYHIAVTAISYYAASPTEYSSILTFIPIYESTFSVVSEISCSHSYSASVTAPTCTERGYVAHICKSCGFCYRDSYTEATGHTPGAAVTEDVAGDSSYDLVTYCMACGCELSREHIGCVPPGDVNGDGSVNNKDLTRLFQYLSGWDVEVSADTLDINGDGSVNNKDLTRLFQYLSGWNVEIH